MKNILLAIILSMCLVACENLSSTTSFWKSKDSIKIDIPHHENGRPVFAYITATQTASQLHLDSLDLGYLKITTMEIWIT